MTKEVGKAFLSYNELETILVEIENIINSRPLTYILGDNEGASYPLTPSQLVNGRNLNCWPNDAHFEIHTVHTYESLSKRQNIMVSY